MRNIEEIQKNGQNSQENEKTKPKFPTLAKVSPRNSILASGVRQSLSEFSLKKFVPMNYLIGQIFSEKSLSVAKIVGIV